jgi:MEDS: MEthanogen/methylotroph, DcmR Sensory domain
MFRHFSLFEFQHNDHTCVFYRSEDVLLEILTPYFKDGLARGEYCFCVQRPEVLHRLVYNLKFLGVDTEKETKRGALDLRTLDEVYFPDNRFEPERMMGLLIKAIGEVRKRGFTGFRSAGEMSWSRAYNEFDKVIDYEKMVDEYYPGKPATSICQYAVNDFSPERLQQAVQSHRMNLTETALNSLHFSMNLEYGHCTAEVVADNFAHDPRYYYVVEVHQSRQLAGWGVASTFAEAREQAAQAAVNFDGTQ